MRFWSVVGSNPDLHVQQFSAMWNACSTTHFSCPEQFFSCLKWDFKSYTLSKAGKKNPQNRSVSNIRPSTSQFAYASSSLSPTCVAFCCCQKGSWSMWGSSNYSLPSSRFLSIPHLFLSPTSPFLSPCSSNHRGSFFPPLLLLSRLGSTAGKQELLGKNVSSRE